jgi:hypothetical protein
MLRSLDDGFEDRVGLEAGVDRLDGGSVFSAMQLAYAWRHAVKLAPRWRGVTGRLCAGGRSVYFLDRLPPRRQGVPSWQLPSVI